VIVEDQAPDEEQTARIMVLLLSFLCTCMSPNNCRSCASHPCPPIPVTNVSLFPVFILKAYLTKFNKHKPEVEQDTTDSMSWRSVHGSSLSVEAEETAESPNPRETQSGKLLVHEWVCWCMCVCVCVCVCTCVCVCVCACACVCVCVCVVCVRCVGRVESDSLIVESLRAHPLLGASGDRFGP
jgi:hypothetical protein